MIVHEFPRLYVEGGHGQIGRHALLVAVVVSILLVPAVIKLEFMDKGVRLDHVAVYGFSLLLIPMVAMRRGLIPGRTMPILSVVGLYIASYIVSTLYGHIVFGYDLDRASLQHLQGVGRAFLYLLMFLVLGERLDQLVVLRIVVGVGLFDIILGGAQFIGVGGLNSLLFDMYLLSDDPDVSREYVLAFNETRASSIFDGYTIHFAAFSLIFVSTAVALMLVKRVRAVPGIGLVVVGALGVLMTQTRGAVLGLIVLAVSLLFVVTKKRLYVGGLFLGTVAVGLVLVTFPERFVRLHVFLPLLSLDMDATKELILADVNVADRIRVGWGEGIRLWTMSPILGHGAIGGLSDTQFIPELYQRGALGLVLFVLIIGLVLRRAIQVVRSKDGGPGERAVGFVVYLSTFALLGMGISFVPVWASRPAELYWSLVGLLLRSSRRS